MTLLRNLKSMGLKSTVRKYARKIVGYSALEEEIETLHYFLNYYEDVSSVQRVDSELRDLQQCDKLLLSIFHHFCEKEGLCYWLDWGSLLGAVRHHGFVPWDDDLDISMPRSDWERVLKLFPKELLKQGIELHEMDGEPLLRLGMGYHHYQTGIWMDIYPVDEIIYADRESLDKNIRAYKKWYAKNRKKQSVDKVEKQKKRLLKQEYPYDKSAIISCLETFTPYDKAYCFNNNDIFPLRKMKFEENEFYVPNKAEEVLKREYGEYERFPKRGVEHHGDEAGKLASWARQNGIDMKQVYQEMNELM